MLESWYLVGVFEYGYPLILREVDALYIVGRDSTRFLFSTCKLASWGSDVFVITKLDVVPWFLLVIMGA